MNKAAGQLRSAKVIRTGNLLLGIGWTIMIPVTLMTGLKDSLPFIAFLSVYSPAIGHLGTWVSGRAEVASIENPSP